MKFTTGGRNDDSAIAHGEDTRVAAGIPHTIEGDVEFGGRAVHGEEKQYGKMARFHGGGANVARPYFP